MRRHVSSRPLAKGFAALLLLCLSASLSAPVSAQPAQERATGKVDEYGPVGFEDEMARLDNFALLLQNRPDLKGYLVVYAGRDTLPGHIPGVLRRAFSYLTQMRGLDAARLEVVNGGFREQKATELWAVGAGERPPTPTDTIEVKREEGKAFQFSASYFNFEFAEKETDGAAVSEDEAQASGDAGETTGDAAQQESQTAADDAASASQGETTDAEESEAETEFEEAVITDDDREASNISLAWNSEGYAEALKEDAQARGCLIVYYDPDGPNLKKVRELVERVKDEFITKHGFASERIVTRFGGYREWPVVEFWIVPRGAEMPEPKVYEKVREKVPEAEQPPADEEQDGRFITSKEY